MKISLLLLITPLICIPDNRVISVRVPMLYSDAMALRLLESGLITRACKYLAGLSYLYVATVVLNFTEGGN